MTKFPIVSTAFSGYRLLAAKPGAAIVWLVFQLAVIVGVTWLTVTMVGPQMAALKEMQSSGTPDPATAMALAGQTFPFTILRAVIGLVVGAIVIGAILRAVLRPGQGALGYLRLGADELRLVVVSLVVIILVAVPAVIGSAVRSIVVVSSVGPAAGMAALQGHGHIPLALLLTSTAAALPGVALAVFLYVKLSLASPQTVGERALRIFGSWRLTKGVFWRTLATYCLAAIPVVILAVIVIYAAMALRGEGGSWMVALEPNAGSMATAFSGAEIAILVLKAFLVTACNAALLVPAAIIYTAVSGQVAPAAVTADDDDDDDEDED